MKREQQPERFYYNITIEHDPAHTDERHFMKSKAEKTIEMETPLMEDPGDYNMSVCKFSINTEAIPIFLPEIKSKQTNDHAYINVFESDDNKYKIYCQVYYTYKLDGNWIKKQNDGDSAVCIFYLPYPNHPNGIKKIKPVDSTKQYWWYDNLDEQCYFYDYTTLLNVINNVIYIICKYFHEKINDGYSRLKYWCEKGNNSSFFYFELKNGLLVLNVHKDVYEDNDYIKDVRIVVKFPMYLYRYIGNGFKTKFNSDGTWEYDYNWKELARINKNIAITQEYSTLVNWNPLKAIVIGSDTIPAVGEFLPIAHYDGWLNHEKSKEYDDFLTATGQTRQDKDKDVFKKNTMNILDIYYPILTNPGDIRSNCVFSRDDISNGQVIELRHASPLTRFNIWIKWLDVYGNLHDLYLLPRCSCDIRFCFIKKSVMREDLGEGISTVVGALAPPEDKKKKRGKSNGKPDGIVLDGADNYGWVHL